MELSDLFRLVNLGTGVLLVLGGILQLFAGITIQHVVIAVYLFIFGGVTALLEFQVPPQISPQLSRYASFMFSFLGRGMFYIFLGCVVLGNSFLSKLNGGLVILVGLGYAVLEFIPSIEPPAKMREADGGWGAEQV